MFFHDADPPPVVVFPGEVWDTMMAYVVRAPMEVNGFGMVDVHDGVLMVTEVFTLDQVVTSVDAKVSPLTVAMFMDELRDKGGDPGRMKFEWHSHVHAPVRFSPTDMAFIRRWPGHWLLSLVLNKQGEYSARFDMYRDGIRVGRPATIQVIRVLPQDLLDAVDADILAKVKAADANGPRALDAGELDQHVSYPTLLRGAGDG